MKDNIQSPDKKRKNLDINETKLFRISHTIKKELESGVDLGKINIAKLNIEDMGNYVFHIISKGKFFTKSNIEMVKYFLNKYTKYGNFEGDKNLFLEKLSMSMHVEKFPKDFLLFRKNDIGDKFYIILKGSVAIVITQEINIEMSQREYIIHLEKLRYFKEYYLLECILAYDNKIEINSELHDLIKDEIYLETKNKKIGDKNNSIPDINAQKFVERVEPFIDKNSKEPKISVRIPIYKIVATLKTGDTFGEVALSKTEVEERKRTATVITDSQCIFGIVGNNIYSTFLREIEEKNRFNLVTKLVSHSIFKMILAETFMKANYLNYFNNMTMKGGKYLFKQGDTKEALYFITDGIINLYTESSIDNIIKVIEFLNNDIDPVSKKENRKELQIIKDYEEQNKSNKVFNKFCKVNRIFKIFSINKKETLAFEDCLFNENQFFLSAKIMSENCHVFVLKLNFLSSMLRENLIARNYKRTNLEKKMIMIKRLTSMVKNLITRFVKNNKITISLDNYLEENKNKTTETSIFKNENFSHRLPYQDNIRISLTKYKNKNSFLNLKLKSKNKIKNLNYIKGKNLFYLNKYLFENKIEKGKNKINLISPKETIFKNKLINLEINFSNDNLQKENKFSLPFVNDISLLKKTKKKRNKNEETCKTEIVKLNTVNNINNLIPNIKKLSNKYMINEYYSRKNKLKNMTQFDFIFYDNLFVSQGKKNYSKEPLLFN